MVGWLLIFLLGLVYRVLGRWRCGMVIVELELGSLDACLVVVLVLVLVLDLDLLVLGWLFLVVLGIEAVRW